MHVPVVAGQTAIFATATICEVPELKSLDSSSVFGNRKRPRLLGAVLVSGSSNDARSCRLWHGSPQAGLRLTDDLLIVIGNDPLHVDACAFDPRFVRQSLELNLNLFSLLRRQEGDGESGGFACGGLSFPRGWVSR